ncbi:mercury(II) reductase [Brachybacterium sacelli]|uniref:Mercuric reductase n=1 Tax=Brachybacterium sacelli TaxID=173364 RepID=A0ABS4X880_9MICO|nr:mercury(II) reductase [Brachybacterium sacelli]MBP2384443.1 mercuric reductase [Brachybacterium sacelli]
MSAAAKRRWYDLAVIGSGGAAFAAAIRASNLGKRVVMIERGTVGGTCVNTGCVPSKALLAAAEARHVTLDATRFPGLALPDVGPVDMPVLVAGKDELVRSLRREKYLDLATAYGWDLLPGEATFVGTPTEPALHVTGPDGTVETVRAAHFLIATGSTPWAPPVPGLEEAGYLTSTTAMELDYVPESLLVIGGGYVAMEQAQLFARLGARVTMLVRSRLASHEEPEAATALEEIFADEGIQIIRGALPSAVRRDPAGGEVTVTATTAVGSQEIRGAEVLVATGRRPVTGTLGLDTVDVRAGKRGEVIVDDHLRSTNARIWAAGDVTAHPQFVYVAAAHGTLVADNAFTGAGREVDYRHLPRVVVTSPALASVGMTDHQARAAGIRCDCRVLPLEHVPRAIVNRGTRGLIKIVADADTGVIVGITALAQDAGDLAAAGVYILEAGMTVDQVANLWSPYLTMAEGLKLTAQSFTTDVTRLSCCAA